ncbi:hypothetical protein SPI_06168 [Niveomyces insectorum RCEF 264]|uniref:Uncharacterized protein n=1 Tax=Niveomyces insectorum RCEF 264 TaxID=1081102 RepID=A0A167RV44_9HYPO|nr:hypothetical protein SPI_06168 [Niveomyces insectorum RCEF 264]
MLAATRDQENRVFGHSVGGVAGKQLQPKTPGAKNVNTPLKVPLNDGNGTARLAGGKSILGGRPNGGNENLRTAGKPGKSNLVTPLEPRTARAPLGNKTTNAKARTIQQQQNQQQQKNRTGVKDIVREIEQSQQQQQQQAPPASTRRARVLSPRINGFKLSVLNDNKVESASRGAGDEEEEDIEYAPPPVPAQPYESDVFPDGVLTFAAFKPENRLRGYYNHYYNPVDDDGVPLREKEFAESQRRAFEELDRRVQEDMDSFDWSVGDVPATKEFLANKRKKSSTPAEPATAVPPPTIVSRKAASALALSSKMTAPGNAARSKAPAAAAPSTRPAASGSFLSALPLRKQRSVPTAALPHRPRNASHPLAETASRTTLGYTKGRTASSLVRGTGGGGGLPPARKAGLAATAAGIPTARSDAAPTTPKTNARVLQRQTTSNSGPEVHSTENSNNQADERTPAFVSIFDTDDTDLDFGGPSTLANVDLDDDFQFDIKF